jgi:hypothetical protein
MAEEKKEYEIEFEFPDEKEAKQQATQEAKAAEESEIEIVDDTPDEDKDPRTGKMREPLPKEIVEELEADELEEYSEKVKVRLKQMKKVWHDERRAKEAAYREQQEAIAFANKILEENKKLRSTLTEGEKNLVTTYKQSAELELDMAKREYKEAYEAGDTDKIVEAQQKIANANYKLQQVASYRPIETPLQPDKYDVNMRSEQGQQKQEIRLDPKTAEWQSKNTWYGTDPEMTALALGYHQKLERERGAQFVGTEEYWRLVDQTMRRRFPDYFGEDEVKTFDGGGKPVQRTENKPATVVAPASRSTSSKRVRLTTRQVSLAKKFGLTPEQYARELQRLENQNG